MLGSAVGPIFKAPPSPFPPNSLFHESLFLVISLAVLLVILNVFVILIGLAELSPQSRAVLAPGLVPPYQPLSLQLDVTPIRTRRF